MKFFKLPKNATIKALLAAAVLQSIFGMVLIEIYNQNGLDWRVVVFTHWLSCLMIFGGVVFVSLSVIAYWFPRTASLVSVCIYAAFIVAQASQGTSVLKSSSIMNIPIGTLLLFALFCALRQTSLSSQIPLGDAAK